MDLNEAYIALKQDALMSVEIVGGELSEGPVEERSEQFAGKLVGGTYTRQTSQSEWQEVPMIISTFYINVLQER